MPKGDVQRGFGWPLKCPKCLPQHYFGRLKVPGDAAGVKTSPYCTNCGTRMVECRPRG